MIGAEIRARREEMGLTRDQLVELLAEEGVTVHVNTVKNHELGVTEPRYTELMAYRKVLGIRLEEVPDEKPGDG